MRTRGAHCAPRIVSSSTGALFCLLVVVVPLMYALGLDYFHGVIEHKAWPYDSFGPSSNFADFNGLQNEWMKFHFGTGPGLVYFPAAFLPIQGLTMFGGLVVQHWFSVGAFVAAELAGITALLWKGGWKILSAGILIVFLSYPVIFDLQTGNLECWVSSLVLCAVALKVRDRHFLAAVLIGFAIAMKGAPIVFLPILWIDGRARAVKTTVVAAATVLVSTISAVLVLPGGGLSAFGRVLDRVQSGQTAYRNLMINTIAGTHFGNSFLNGIHAFFGQSILPSTSASVVDGVGIIGLVLLAGAFVFAARHGARLWMLLAICGSAGCLLVPTSTDYKLLYFVPAIITLLAEPTFWRDWLLGTFLLCFIVTPKPWGLRPGGDPFVDAGVYLTPLLMILLCAWIVVRTWIDSKVGERRSGDQR